MEHFYKEEKKNIIKTNFSIIEFFIKNNTRFTVLADVKISI